MRKLAAILGLALAVASGYAWGQSTLFQTTLNGTEAWSIATGGPGGASFFTNTSQMRNASALKTFASVAGNPTYQALTTDSVLYWVGSAPTTWTITTPVAPWDGQILQIGTDTTLTSMVTLTAATGQSLNSSYTNQTISAKTSVEFMYSAATTKWYEMR